ncbi:MAG: hypothetical protein QOD25_3123 [Alphaproteobacteria bacterium]|nr:hypothetical protein [Alphaproteobacteria bacterium]
MSFRPVHDPGFDMFETYRGGISLRILLRQTGAETQPTQYLPQCF